MKNILTVTATTFLILTLLTTSPVYAATVTVSTDKMSYSPGQVLKVSGTVSPVTAGKDVAIIVNGPTGEQRAVAQATPSADGTYSKDVMTFAAGNPSGTWTVKVTYQEAATALTTFTFAVSQAAITVRTDKASYGPGNILKVSGTVSPVAAGQDMAILVYNPSGALKAVDQVTPSSTGSYSKDLLTFASDDPTGTWSVKATYQGVSATTSFTFAPPVGTGTFTPSSPSLLDSAGKATTSVSKNTAFYVQIKLTSNVGTSLSVYVIAQIKDSTGGVTAMGITAADVGAGATKDVPVAFLGLATPDIYTVTLFVWSSITDPTALAPKTTFTITIV
jgi:hypothetical protein